MNRNPRLIFWWPLAFGTLIGIEITLTALVLFGPAKLTPELASQLTHYGKVVFSPEHDVMVYAAGCCVSILLIGGLSLVWKVRLARATDEGRDAFIRHSCAQLCIAGALFLLHLELLLVIRHLYVFDGAAFPVLPFFILAMPLIASLAMAFAERTSNIGVAPHWLVRLLADSPARLEIPEFSFNSFFDILVPLLLCAVIYIPDGRSVAGNLFVQEEFHHLNLFVMGPALAYHHGKALDTEAFSQYGVGWPLVFSALSGWIPLTYGKLIQAGATYGCLYFVALYIFLRLVLGSVAWASFGAVFALSIQLFHGVGAAGVIWSYPSSTVMRSAMDIWFFIILLFHLRTRRAIWAVSAGVLVGLAVLFETDTGIYLALTFAAYFVFSSGLTYVSHSRARGTLFSILSGFASAAIVLLTGLTLASRGTILRKEFWIGWTESLVASASGISMLPIAVVPDKTMLYFTFVIAIYFGAIGMAVVKSLRRESTPADVLLGCVASYGALILILFVGRSQPADIFRSLLPFSLALSIAGAWSIRQLSRIVNFPVMPSLIPWCLVVLLTAELFTNRSFRNYPGISRRILVGPTPQRLCLLQSPEDVCGLPTSMKSDIDNFGAVAALLRDYDAAGQTVAVLDVADTVYYLAADAKPWWRYSPSFALIYFRSQLDQLQHDVAASGPTFVIIRGTATHATFWSAEDVWLAVHQTVESTYTLERTIGDFEIWQRNRL